MDLLTFTLLLFGVVYIITQSAIMAPLRMPFASLHPVCATLIYCCACTGAWVGGALAALGYWPGAEGGRGVIEATVVACGLGAVWSVYGPESPWGREQALTASRERALADEEESP